jgi:hypothetical protein
MKLHALILLSACVAVAADDGWSKVIELKSGTELRIYKKGATQPLLAKMDEANDERIVVVLRNEQTAIPKDQIERLDRRPEQKGSRVKAESKVTTEQPGARADLPMPRSGSPQGTSTSSGLTIGGKPDFETIYRRRAALPPPSK